MEGKSLSCERESRLASGHCFPEEKKRTKSQTLPEGRPLPGRWEWLALGTVLQKLEAFCPQLLSSKLLHGNGIAGYLRNASNTTIGHSRKQSN